MSVRTTVTLTLLVVFMLTQARLARAEQRSKLALARDGSCQSTIVAASDAAAAARRLQELFHQDNGTKPGVAKPAAKRVAGLAEIVLQDTAATIHCLDAAR